ncbi:hypothetical protein [Micromonospora sp. CPCC 206061]|uniref:hypothetical protein n=1 Tax=Micromonospora sp. CPCC 206061 TaxID=3122410 RepID=UPI002FF3E510
MAEAPRYPDGDNREERPADALRRSESAAGMPRWVKVVGIIAIVVAVLVLVMLLTGLGGEHGPGRHSAAGAEHGRQLPAMGVVDGGYASAGVRR